MKKHIYEEYEITVRQDADIPTRKPEDPSQWHWRKAKALADKIRSRLEDEGIDVSDRVVHRDVCSHCNSTWEEDEDGFPVCCDAAVTELEAK